jgi:hypothetical protein
MAQAKATGGGRPKALAPAADADIVKAIPAGNAAIAHSPVKTRCGVILDPFGFHAEQKKRAQNLLISTLRCLLALPGISEIDKRWEIDFVDPILLLRFCEAR